MECFSDQPNLKPQREQVIKINRTETESIITVYKIFITTIKLIVMIIELIVQITGTTTTTITTANVEKLTISLRLLLMASGSECVHVATRRSQLSGAPSM